VRSYFEMHWPPSIDFNACSALLGLEAAAAEDSTRVDAAAAPVSSVISAIASCDADDEIQEAPSTVISAPKAVAGSISAQINRKGRNIPSGATVASASTMQPQSQLQAPSSSAGSVGSSTSVTGSSVNDPSLDYLSSSSTGSLKHDDAAAIALKQSTFQVLKEGVLSKPKSVGKKDNSKAKAVVNPSIQHISQFADMKVDAPVSSAKPVRSRLPQVPSISLEEPVKLDPFLDPLRLASCASFLALPSYAAVFEKKALCFDISHAKCYRWLVPRRSLVLIVDRDAHLLRGVFETTGTVIMDPRKDVPSAMSAHVPISPLKDLFSPISLARVAHLINLNALCEENPFESLTSAQFSTIFQMFSSLAVTQPQPPSTIAIDVRDANSAQQQASFAKQSLSSSAAAPLNGLNSSSALKSQESFDSTKAPSDYRQPNYASPMAGFHQGFTAQPVPQRTVSSARPLYQPFPSTSGASIGNSGLPSFPRFQSSAVPAVPAAAPMFNAVATSYAPVAQHSRNPVELPQTPYSAGTWGGYSPWGGFDQRIFGRNESPESVLGGLHHEYQQVAAPTSEEVPAMPFFWSGASSSSQQHAAPQPKSRFFGKVEAEHRHGNSMSHSAGMQRLDIQDHGGIRQMPWAPMEHHLSSGMGTDDFGSNSFTTSSQQQWQNLSAELLDQRGKAVHKH
jgi:hypothetical protein